MNISVFGCGAWGTALSMVLADNNHKVLAWSFEEKTKNDINNQHENIDFLSGFKLSPNINASLDPQEVAQFSNIWIGVLPSQTIRGFFQKLNKTTKQISFVNASKGIELGTGKLLNDVYTEIFPQNYRVCNLSGPSFANEVADKQPTLVTLSGTDANTIESIAELFKTPYFRPYKSDDVVGTEIGGALKNVIAIASGVALGCGFRINSQSALLTRALSEISRFGLAHGAKLETFMGLSGMGDLILTCLGELSRNKALGIEIGKGGNPKKVLESKRTVAEGYYTAKAVYNIIEHKGLDLPMLKTIYEVLYEDKKPLDALKYLMLRPTRWE